RRARRAARHRPGGAEPSRASGSDHRPQLLRGDRASGSLEPARGAGERLHLDRARQRRLRMGRDDEARARQCADSGRDDHRRTARQPARRHDHRRDGVLAPGHGAAGGHRSPGQGLSADPGCRAGERARLRGDQPARRSVVLRSRSPHPSPRVGEGLMLARVLRRRKTALAGALILAAVGLAALFAPALAPYDPIRIRPADALSPPSLAHPFGTDQYGRDILSRAITPARLSLLTGVGAVAVALTTGVVVGLACGVIGGWTDLLVMRAVDIMMAFPGILMALVVVAVLGQGTVNV